MSFWEKTSKIELWLLVFFTLMNYICVNRGRYLYECLVTCLEKHPSHQDKNYWYFSLSLTFFENINQEHMHSLLPDCASLDSLLMYCKNLSQVSLPSLLNGNNLFRSMANGNCLFNWTSLSLVGDNPLAHKRRVLVAAKLHLNATYAQHLALKPVYDDEKRQARYIMGGKLFSSRTVCLN